MDLPPLDFAETVQATPTPAPPHVYQSPANVAGGIAKVRYTHLDMIDTIILNPQISQNELAARYGYTPAWVSRIIASDSFRKVFADRRESLVDPGLLADIEERMRAVAMKSWDVILEKLGADPTLDGALKAAELASRALGYGAPKGGGTTVNVAPSFVVHLPQKADDSADWTRQYGRPEAKPIDVTPVPLDKP